MGRRILKGALGLNELTDKKTHADFVNRSGASCSKLTMLFFNNSLKFQMAILQIHCYFLLKKCENPLKCNAKDSHIFSTKNNSVFASDLCQT